MLLLAALALVFAELYKSSEDDEERPGEHDEAPRKNAERSQEEIEAEEHDERGNHLMVLAVADFALRVVVVHDGGINTKRALTTFLKFLLLL